MSQTVSIVIPTYNYARFIAEAIDSVLAQTYPISEIIVVDDGSTDGTEDVVRRFGERVRYIKQKNAGVCAARNNGVEKSSGELIAFLDADDTWLPEKIEKQVEKFTGNKEIGLVHCGMREFDSGTGETIMLRLEGGEGWLAEDMVLWEKPVVNVSGSIIVVSRKAFYDVGRFDTELKVGEDWDFCYRVAKLYKVGFVPEALVNYRNHGVNAHLNVSEMERGMSRFYEKAFRTGGADVLKLRRKAYGNFHRVLSGSYFRAGNYFEFSRHAIISILYRPSNLSYFLKFPLRRLRKDR
ncbi:MAG: glycosyltransferase family 2 protein [Blastocatellia bacterium]